MKLLEYEAKDLLKKAGLPVPRSVTIASPNDDMQTPVVLKSQVPVGGRGKAGGVQVVENNDELAAKINEVLSLSIKGHTPKVLLAEEKIAIAREHYLSLLIDQESAAIRLVAHVNGGVEVEANDTSDFLNLPIDESSLQTCAAQLAEYLKYEISRLLPLVENIYAAFVKNDATLLEINPLIFTSDGNFMCGDCKMTLDDAASFRHPEWDFEDKPAETNFVVLDTAGSVATIANGAGLAMATVDAVAARGMKPANFLDIGGGANTESVLNAFQRIVEFPDIKAIVINIFAGITRCDEVARAIIAAKKQISGLPPLFIRLAGTNFEEAVQLLAEENIATLATLEECLAAAKEASDA